MPYSIEEIAKLIDGEVVQAKPGQQIVALKALKIAGEGELSFFEPSSRVMTTHDLAQSKASVVITDEAHIPYCKHAAIKVKNPKQCFAKVAALFEETFVPKVGIHESAVIGQHSHISDQAAIGPGVVIGDHVTIQAGAIIEANTVIGDHSFIGHDSHVFANVTIYPKSIIGNKVVINSATVIGADGFGFVPNEKGHWQRVPQLGNVVIQDNVSIGASCTIDCGALADTLIEEGVKIDDQVHIAHNVVVGAHTVIAGCCAIAGSVTIGKHCILAGGVRFADNLTVTDKVIITAGSTIAKSITESGVYGCGFQVAPMAKWRRILGRIYQLDDLAKRLIKLEKKVND